MERSAIQIPAFLNHINPIYILLVAVNDGAELSQKKVVQANRVSYNRRRFRDFSGERFE
jgi:hypothetical protein